MSLIGKLLLGLLCLCGLFVGAVFLYHWSRIRECERPLQPLIAARATRAEVISKLGPPYDTAGPAQAGRYTAQWSSLGEGFTTRVQQSRETLAYMDGEFVFFVHLGSDGRATSLTCIGN